MIDANLKEVLEEVGISEAQWEYFERTFKGLAEVEDNDEEL